MEPSWVRGLALPEGYTSSGRPRGVYFLPYLPTPLPCRTPFRWPIESVTGRVCRGGGRRGVNGAPEHGSPESLSWGTGAATQGGGLSWAPSPGYINVSTRARTPQQETRLQGFFYFEDSAVPEGGGWG